MSQLRIADYEASKPLVDGATERLRDQIVGDAPADADEVLSQIPVLPGWLRVSIIVGSAAGLWAALICGVRALLGA
ncbi:hypothetical protein LJR225_004953 [Phenylobacterium sp. LjRoot225]|uniref:hypothetical protein n=1 Tax=Phenylobacterium sp. LjRoot225 TaxID=3342285 RepID=UPI003ED125BE